MLAVHEKNTEIIKELLKHKKIDVNAKDDEGYNALMYAYPDIKIIKLLLEHENIDIMTPIKGNKIFFIITPILLACWSLY